MCRNTSTIRQLRATPGKATCLELILMVHHMQQLALSLKKSAQQICFTAQNIITTPCSCCFLRSLLGAATPSCALLPSSFGSCLLCILLLAEQCCSAVNSCGMPSPPCCGSTSALVACLLTCRCCHWCLTRYNLAAQLSSTAPELRDP